MSEKQDWEGKGYSFFSNRECEYFPCHETEDADNFNCIFCYCPLYALGNQCGGNFHYTEKGVKDCSQCGLPHRRKNFGYVIDKFQEIVEVTKKNNR